MRHFASVVRVVSLVAAASVASATQINVALLSAIGNSTYNTNIVNSIEASAPFLNLTIVDVSTTTPDLGQLESYSSVMVVSNGLPFRDYVTLGNNLASYVGAGHGVVVAAYANCTNCGPGIELGGTFATSDYWALEPAGENTTALSHTTLGTVYQPASPLVANVSTLDGGSAVYYVNGAVNAAATDVADWSTGVPLVAARSFSGGGIVVGLNLYPPNNLAYPTLWVSTTNGGNLMADALNYAAGDSAVPEGNGYLLSGVGLAGLSLLLRTRPRR